MWTELSVRQLLAVRAVAEEGTFGRAAERLGYTQSAVSQQVAGLEKLVGHRLFDRPAGPTPPRLTDAGRLVMGHAEAVLGRLEQAEAELDRFTRGVTGSLTIGTFQSVSARVLPLTLKRLRDEAPEVDVSLVDYECDQDEQLLALERGDLDLAFIAGPVEGAFEIRALGSDPYVAVVPSDHPEGRIDLHDLSGQPVVGLPAGDACGAVVDRGLERLGVSPQYAFRSNDNGAVQGMVAAGVGLAVLPLLTVDLSDRRVDVRPTTPPLEPRRLSLVSATGVELAPVASRFTDITAEVCAALLEAPPLPALRV